MARFRLLPLVPVVLAACTPLGGYLYGDPTFALTEVRVSDYEGAGAADSLLFVVTGCNLNDFDLLGTSMTMSLTIEGELVGEVQSDAMYALGMRDSTTLNEGVAIPLVVLRRGGADARPTPYVLVGATTLRTPIGERLVEFEVEGDVRISGEPPQLTATGSKTTCRPGRSTIPGLPAPRLLGPEIPDVPDIPRDPAGVRRGERP